MALLNKLFRKTKKEEAKKEPVKEEKKAAALKKQIILESNILVSPHTAEKAIMGQKLNQYVFKVAPRANKISIAKEVKRVYNVKAVKVNIINIPPKARRVGRTEGFKAGYKKAIVTLAPGQTIELK